VTFDKELHRVIDGGLRQGAPCIMFMPGLGDPEGKLMKHCHNQVLSTDYEIDEDTSSSSADEESSLHDDDADAGFPPLRPELTTTGKAPAPQAICVNEEGSAATEELQPSGAKSGAKRQRTLPADDCSLCEVWQR